MMNVKTRIYLMVQLLLVSLLVSCVSANEEPKSDGPLVMNGPSDFGTHTVALAVSEDGREHVIGNVRGVNVSSEFALTLVSATARDAQNVEVGVFQLVRPTEEDGAATGYLVPPRPGDDLYEMTKPVWEASESAAGASVQPKEDIILIVGLVQPDPSVCSAIAGIDVAYQFAGITYVATWKTGYVIEVDEDEGCEHVNVVE